MTGTPSGAGLGTTPPAYFKAGDEIRTRVADQTLHHTVIARPTPHRQEQSS